MKLLLDESVPRRLASSFPESFTLHTVQGMGWAGTGNGLLLSLAAGEDFDAFLTVDRGIEFAVTMMSASARMEAARTWRSPARNDA